MLQINRRAVFSIFFTILFTAGIFAQMKPMADTTMHHQMKEELRTGHKMDGKSGKMMEDGKMIHSEHMKGMMKDSVLTDMHGKKIFNMVCPVSGESVDPDEDTYVYNGKNYGFCCSKCIKKFKADPEKYIGNLSEDGKTFVSKKKTM